MEFPKWLSRNAFLAALILTAIARYKATESTGFSTEGVVGWVISSLVGGVFWGAVFTWLGKKFGKKGPGV